MISLNKNQFFALVGLIVTLFVITTIGTNLWSLVVSAGHGLISLGGTVATIVLVVTAAAVIMLAIAILTRTTLAAMLAALSWKSFWNFMLNVGYISLLVVALWLVVPMLWNLYHTGLPSVSLQVPQLEGVRNLLGLRLDGLLLLKFLIASLIFLLFAPPASGPIVKTLVALAAFVFVWLAFNTFETSGFGDRFKKWLTEAEACARNDNCSFFTPAPSTPKLSLNLPRGVQVPHCDERWSDMITIPPRMRVVWEFADWPVKTLVGKGSVKRVYSGDPDTDGSAVRFCTRSALHVDKYMELTWKPY